MPRLAESNIAVLPNLDASTEVAVRFAKKPAQTTDSRGLCSNCDLRETCLYARQGGVVWYCEEYK